MRGQDQQTGHLFSYVSAEDRVPEHHPLRAIRPMVDAALARLSPRFDALYSRIGRPSIPPEQLLRALVVQVLYSVRSERLLMEQLQYNLLFRWFVGLQLDDAVWVPTVFSKNRDRLLEGDLAEAFFDDVVAQAGRPGCCRTSTLRSTARCSRRGPARRASGPRSTRRPRATTTRAIPP